MLMVNDVLAFVLEMLALYMWGKFAFSLSENTLISWGLAILTVVIVALIWGIFFSPKASYSISGPLRWLLEYIILFTPFVFNYSKNWLLLIIVAVVIAANLFIQAYYGRTNL